MGLGSDYTFHPVTTDYPDCYWDCFEECTRGYGIRIVAAQISWVAQTATIGIGALGVTEFWIIASAAGAMGGAAWDTSAQIEDLQADIEACSEACWHCDETGYKMPDNNDRVWNWLGDAGVTIIGAPEAFVDWLVGAAEDVGGAAIDSLGEALEAIGDVLGAIGRAIGGIFGSDTTGGGGTDMECTCCPSLTKYCRAGRIIRTPSEDDLWSCAEALTAACEGVFPDPDCCLVGFGIDDIPQSEGPEGP